MSFKNHDLYSESEELLRSSRRKKIATSVVGVFILLAGIWILLSTFRGPQISLPEPDYDLGQKAESKIDSKMIKPSSKDSGVQDPAVPQNSWEKKMTRLYLQETREKIQSQNLSGAQGIRQKTGQNTGKEVTSAQVSQKRFSKQERQDGQKGREGQEGNEDLKGYSLQELAVLNQQFKKDLELMAREGVQESPFSLPEGASLESHALMQLPTRQTGDHELTDREMKLRDIKKKRLRKKDPVGQEVLSNLKEISRLLKEIEKEDLDGGNLGDFIDLQEAKLKLDQGDVEFGYSESFFTDEYENGADDSVLDYPSVAN